MFLQEKGGDAKNNTEVKSEPVDEAEAAPAAFVCTPEQLMKLAENLSQVDNWKKLSPKLGLTEESLQKLFSEKKATETKGEAILLLVVL